MKKFLVICLMASTIFATAQAQEAQEEGKKPVIKDSYGFARETGGILSQAKRCNFHTEITEKRTKLAISAIATSKDEDIPKAIGIYKKALESAAKADLDCNDVKIDYNMLLKILSSGGF